MEAAKLFAPLSAGFSHTFLQVALTPETLARLPLSPWGCVKVQHSPAAPAAAPDPWLQGGCPLGAPPEGP